MILFEQLKNIPKVDLHINLTSSISTDLVYELNEFDNIIDVEDSMIEKNYLDYYNSLDLPIKTLSNKKNITLAVNNLIDKLENDNVIYAELFLDLFLYNNKLKHKMVIDTILDIINERNYKMNLVLVLSSKFDKDTNIKLLDLLDSYYNKGINGVYFYKDKMDNIIDYQYIFDRLKKNNIPYILDLNTKITSVDYEIYNNANRIIYSLPNIENEIITKYRTNNIMLEFPISSLMEKNVISNLKEYIIFLLYKDNYNITLSTRDMTTLDTDLINEYCKLFNNLPFLINDLVKILINNINNINDSRKNEILELFSKEVNDILE